MEYLHRLFDERIRPGGAVLWTMALLLAACGGGGGSDGGGTSPTPPPPSPPPAPSASVTISGTVAYEFVPSNLNCRGLDFTSTEERPIRGATVQLVDLSNRELGRTVSGEDGSYSFADVEPNLDVRIRVRAELKKTGTPSWDVEVRDNVVAPDDTSPPALADRPLYAIVSDFNTGSSADLTRDLTARSGWDEGSNAYTGTRAAAPFAVLDSVYTAMQLVLSVDPAAAFSPLDAFWSSNNGGSEDVFDVDTGEFGVSFYSPAVDSLFLLGDAGSDTEEFDSHVIIHEWGHYFEDNFSRSDSIGGPHFLGDQLDARLAFGEGWATALAAIALRDPAYCDTFAAGSGGGLLINAESGVFGGQGWYDEVSVVRFIYDLWDTNNEDTDTGSIGFGPIYDVMTGPQTLTPAFTTIFTFARELRDRLDVQGATLVNSQLVDEMIDPSVLNIWGDDESNDGGRQDALPLYVDFVADGSPTRICVNNSADGRSHGNKLAEHRYLRTVISSPAPYRIEINTVNPPSTPDPGFDCEAAFLANPDDPNVHFHSDPDVVLTGAGVPFLSGGEGLSCTPNQEIAVTSNLPVGEYVLGMNEFRYSDELSPVDFPARMCFDVTMQAVQ
jgi:hypothetical protein